MLFPNTSIVLEDVDTHRSNFRLRVNAQTKRRQSHVNAGTVPESENVERKVDLWPALDDRDLDSRIYSKGFFTIGRYDKIRHSVKCALL